VIVNAPGARVAARCEVYVRGMELANGYDELLDAAEQRRRFAADNALRREHGLPEIPLDECFLAALAHGLPACSGIALGVDRLLMLRVGAASLDEVLAFSAGRC
jgi:lysyl-tRNA synthetase class 2